RPRLRVEDDDQPLLVEERVAATVRVDAGGPPPAGEDRVAREDAAMGLEPEGADEVTPEPAGLEQTEVHDHAGHAHRRLRALVDPARRVVALDLLVFRARRAAVLRAHALHRAGGRRDGAPLGAGGRSGDE